MSAGTEWYRDKGTKMSNLTVMGFNPNVTLNGSNWLPVAEIGVFETEYLPQGEYFVAETGQEFSSEGARFGTANARGGFPLLKPGREIWYRYNEYFVPWDTDMESWWEWVEQLS
jgi:hypothetical protein